MRRRGIPAKLTVMQLLFLRRLPKASNPPVVDRAWDRMIERARLRRKNASSSVA